MKKPKCTMWHSRHVTKKNDIVERTSKKIKIEETHMILLLSTRQCASNQISTIATVIKTGKQGIVIKQLRDYRETVHAMRGIVTEALLQQCHYQAVNRIDEIEIQVFAHYCKKLKSGVVTDSREHPLGL